MNETRFIELLNLYVDQQLSAAEAAELESEIKQNPARRRTYQQYCRMQKACAQLFEHERSAAPASAVLARDIKQADRKVINFPADRARPLWSTGFSFAAVAAAACVAFVVVNKRDGAVPDSTGATVATITAQPAANPVELVSALVAPVSVGAGESEFKPIFTAQNLRAPERQDLFFVTTARTEESRLEWMRQVKLEPVRKFSAEDFIFGSRAPADKAVNATFSPGATDEQVMEMNAFQFQR